MPQPPMGPVGVLPGDPCRATGDSARLHTEPLDRFGMESGTDDGKCNSYFRHSLVRVRRAC